MTRHKLSPIPLEASSQQDGQSSLEDEYCADVLSEEEYCDEDLSDDGIGMWGTDRKLLMKNNTDKIWNHSRDHKIDGEEVPGAEMDLVSQQDDRQSSSQKMVNHFPSAVFFILGNEFCERFCYYGLRTVLVLYLSKELLMQERTSIAVYHAWVFLCYFTPLFGALMADSYIGRYKTILLLSSLYLTGNVLLSAAAVKPLLRNINGKIGLSALGLVLIAFGTGGIKPCVSAFGGDQFQLPRQKQMLTKFFSIFYFSINTGSLLSTLLTPILRKDVSCFGGECFALAFAVPALLMFLALGLFLMGTPQYKIAHSHGNISDVIKCIWCAGSRKIRTLFHSEVGRRRPSHWLHLAGDRYSQSLIAEVKMLLRVLVLYLPLPLFWALYDQQGSRWTFQATKMSGKLGLWTIKPDQMQVLNPILVLVMIPIFHSVLYPFLVSRGLLKNPLRRMIAGSLLVSSAFVVSGIVQIAVEDSLEYHQPEEGGFNFFAMNILPCPIRLSIDSTSSYQLIPPHDLIRIPYTKQDRRHLKSYSWKTGCSLNLKILPYGKSPHCQKLARKSVSTNITIEPGQKEIFAVVVYYLEKLMVVRLPNSRYETNMESDLSSIIRIIDSTDILRISTLSLIANTGSLPIKNEFFSKGISYAEVSLPSNITEFELIIPSEISEKETNSLGRILPTCRYSVMLIYSSTTPQHLSRRRVKISPISQQPIHMLWQLPQYVLISAGEVLFSVTGLEFSYKQAPSSMRSVIQAAWLLTDALGNLFVLIIAESIHLKRESMEVFLFAGLLSLNTFLFYLLAKRFQFNLNDEKPVEIRHLISEDSDTS